MTRIAARCVQGLAPCVAALALVSCGGEREAFRVAVHAMLDGAPIGGVEISEGGVRLGETGADGMLRLAADRPEGTRIELSARCPEGHRARPAQLEARLRRLESTNGSGEPPSLTFEVRCERRVRDVVVVVDAGIAGLEVLIDGRVIDATDAAGLAHLTLQQPPGQRFVVSLDTSSHPELAPPDPEQRFTVSSRDEVFYWARPLSDVVEEVDGDRRRRRRGRGRGGSGDPRSIERLR